MKNLKSLIIFEQKENQMSLKITEEIQESQTEQANTAEKKEIWTIEYLCDRFSLMNKFVEDAIVDIAKTIALELHQQNIYIAVYQDVITKCHSLQEECAFYTWLDEDKLYKYFENRVVEALKNNNYYNVIYHHTHESRQAQELDNTAAYQEFAENLKSRQSLTDAQPRLLVGSFFQQFSRKFSKK
ncbi:UNKNOWN [Stylonychia lemnae]|uniref:Uncharacterized protein n=1 Tax=Stylonychia lemnae TaxID=5949 RepID=A0A077ZSN1_STYLE|nr:UNKNOWN [Stylonychia lemnae]|eukprot:CDW72315.1 UNKNOWN [Stylonychia lemnae]